MVMTSSCPSSSAIYYFSSLVLELVSWLLPMVKNEEGVPLRLLFWRRRFLVVTTNFVFCLLYITSDAAFVIPLCKVLDKTDKSESRSPSETFWLFFIGAGGAWTLIWLLLLQKWSSFWRPLLYSIIIFDTLKENKWYIWFIFVWLLLSCFIFKKNLKLYWIRY